MATKLRVQEPPQCGPQAQAHSQVYRHRCRQIRPTLHKEVQDRLVSEIGNSYEGIRHGYSEGVELVCPRRRPNTRLGNRVQLMPAGVE